jgi:hypothetical protein
LFLAVAVVTVYAGVQVLATARSEVLVAILGVILIINSIISFTRFRIPPPRPERERAWSGLCGGLGGIMFGMTGNFIVPGILFLQALNLKRDMMVQALGLTFCTISAALALSMTQRSMLTPDLMMVSAGALVPAALRPVAGHALPQVDLGRTVPQDLLCGPAGNRLFAAVRRAEEPVGGVRWIISTGRPFAEQCRHRCSSSASCRSRNWSRCWLIRKPCPARTQSVCQLTETI